MLITNCQIIFRERIERGTVEIEAGQIKRIYLADESRDIGAKNQAVIDAKGMYLAPGFIDIHIHGAGGYDAMEGTTKALTCIAKSIIKHGTTAFVPTTMTASVLALNKTLQVVKELRRKPTGGAQVLGAHLEGPFISGKALGAQNPKYLLKPSIQGYEKIVQGCEEVVLSMTLAPELEGAEALIKYAAKQGIVCSVGHSSATYEEMEEGVKWGISHVTHLYNAMTPFSHRQPGIVGAAFDSNLSAEVIADGIHSSYAALRIAFKQKTTDQMLLITDAMMACCMPDGQYELGGQLVFMKDGAARLESGVLAGSVLTLDRAIYNVYTHCHLPLYEVVKMATYNPARFCKLEHLKGLIKEGYDADLVLFDERIQIKKVWVGGQEV